MGERSNLIESPRESPYRYSSLETSDEANATSETNGKAVAAYLRYITVEPIFFGSAFLIAMYSMLEREYIYAETARKYGLSGNESEASCGASINISDTQYLLKARVSAETSTWILYLNIATFGASTFSTMLLGPWSDTVGRKIPLLMGLSGLLFLIIAYIFVINLTLPIPFLLLGHLVCGILGDYATILSASYAHITDVSNEEDRTFRLAVAKLIVGIASFLANILSGIWVDAHGFQSPFWLLLAIAIFNIIYASIRFETTMKGNLLDNLKDLVTFRSLVHVYDVIKWNGEGSGRRRSILLYIVCHFIFVLVMVGIKDVLLVYEIGVPFCWSRVLAGYSLGVTEAGSVVSMILIRIFKGVKAEVYLVMVAVVANLALCATLAFAKMSWHIVLAQCFQLFTIVISPIVKSQMTRIVAEDEVGSVFALLEVARSIGSLAASAIFNGIFAVTIDTTFPGAVFLVGVGAYLVFAALYWIAFKLSKLGIASK